MKAPKLPDSYFNIARVKTLSASISIPSKQHIIQETVCRGNVQILGHVVWFKMAIEELNNRIQELASEIRSSGDLDSVKESTLTPSLTEILPEILILGGLHNKSFCDKRTQQNTSYANFSVRASRGGRLGKRK